MPDPLAAPVMGLLRLYAAGHRMEMRDTRNPMAKAYHWFQAKRYEAALTVMQRRARRAA